MKLSIYSLKSVLFQGDASLLNCKTTMGEITVLDNHEALITVLAAGNIMVATKNAEDKYFLIKSGFLEVKPGNEVRCIVEQ